MDVASLSGLAPAIQFDRLESALAEGRIRKKEALELAAKVGLPEDMQARLQGSKVVAVGYAERGGNARERAQQGDIVVGSDRNGLGKEIALKTGRPVAKDVEVDDPRDDPNYASNLFASVHDEGVRDLKKGRELYGRGLAACVLDVTNGVPPKPAGAFSGALREATLAALETAVLGRFRDAVGKGFREPVPSFGEEWHTYSLGANLRVCDQFSEKLFIAGLKQKLEVLDDAGRVLESVESLNGNIGSWTRNVYDEGGNITRSVKIWLGSMPQMGIYEMGDKGLKSALEVHFYSDSSGTHVDVTKQAANGEWVRADYDNAKKYALDTGFHDQPIEAKYGDEQHLSDVTLVTETPTGPDYSIRGANSFQDANARLYRGDKELPNSWQDKAGERATWDRKEFRFHRNGHKINGGAMNVYRRDKSSVIVEHPGREAKAEPARVEFPMRLSFDEQVLPALLEKALG